MSGLSNRLIRAHADFRTEFESEVRSRAGEARRLTADLYEVSCDTSELPYIWAKDEWPSYHKISFGSISEARNLLKEFLKGSAGVSSVHGFEHVSLNCHRRGELVLEGLKRYREPCIVGWPEREPASATWPARKISYSLFSENEIWVTDSSCEAFAGGEWRFEEDRENPPSRAYLKLWEWGYRTNSLPTKGQVALDLAACPGGWTWVLVKEGLHVHAYDRAPLDKRLMKRYGRQIEFSTGDIFKLSPDRAPKVDWVFCDVIAEPVRTFELIEKWLSEPVGLVFTIKFKGEKTKDDVELLSRLQRVPGASLRHLFVNKNEVTFWRPPQRRP